MNKWRKLGKNRIYEFRLGDSPRAPIIESTCIFDGLYFIGDEFVGSYVLDTTEGLIMVDCGYDDDYFFEQIDNAFKKFELSYKDLKYILISHGHFDHFGCAQRLKKLSGAFVCMAKKEYELACNNSFQLYGPMKVRPDIFIKDNDVIELGNQQIHCIFTKGHTEENTSFIFKVFDEDETYMAELFSGCGITRFMDEEKIRTYIEFVKKWSMMTERYNTQVVLSMHPMQVNTKERIELIENINNRGVMNPFIVGRKGCVMFEQLLLHRGEKALKQYQ